MGTAAGRHSGVTGVPTGARAVAASVTDGNRLGPLRSERRTTASLGGGTNRMRMQMCPRPHCATEFDSLKRLAYHICALHEEIVSCHSYRNTTRDTELVSRMGRLDRVPASSPGEAEAVFLGGGSSTAHTLSPLSDHLWEPPDTPEGSSDRSPAQAPHARLGPQRTACSAYSPTICTRTVRSRERTWSKSAK